MTEPRDATRLQRLFQLASPSLPIGGFAYSEGLETMVENRILRTAADVENWVGGVLHHTLAWLDVPVLLRLQAGWQRGDEAEVIAWSRYLTATRETAERRAQERHLGRALATLLTDLGLERAGSWRPGQAYSSIATFAGMLALAASEWAIEARDAASALVWAWLEAQVLAAVKLVPLGQTEGQRVLFELTAAVPGVLATAEALDNDDIAGALPGATLASARHEQLYSRLFRS